MRDLLSKLEKISSSVQLNEGADEYGNYRQPVAPTNPPPVDDGALDITQEAAGPGLDTVYPDTKDGVLQYMQYGYSKSFLKKLDLPTCKIHSDPQVEGVWAVDSMASGFRCIIYLAGYRDPWGKKRERNDNEEGSFTLPYMKKLIEHGSLDPKRMQHWVKCDSIDEATLKNLIKYYNHFRGLDEGMYDDDDSAMSLDPQPEWNDQDDEYECPTCNPDGRSKDPHCPHCGGSGRVIDESNAGDLRDERADARYTDDTLFDPLDAERLPPEELYALFKKIGQATGRTVKQVALDRGQGSDRYWRKVMWVGEATLGGPTQRSPEPDWDEDSYGDPESDNYCDNCGENFPMSYDSCPNCTDDLVDEATNHLGDYQYQTWGSWRKACIAAGATKIDKRDEDGIAYAWRGPRQIGDWGMDTEFGTVYADNQPAGELAEAEGVSSPKSSIATMLGKLHRVIDSVQTIDQLNSASRFADIVTDHVFKKVKNREGFAGIGNATATLRAIKHDLNKKRQAISSGMATEGAYGDDGWEPPWEQPEKFERDPDRDYDAQRQREVDGELDEGREDDQYSLTVFDSLQLANGQGTCDTVIYSAKKDMEVPVYVEFDYELGQSARPNPDMPNPGPATDDMVEITSITLNNGKEIPLYIVDYDTDNLIEAIYAQLESDKMGESVQTFEGKTTMRKNKINENVDVGNAGPELAKILRHFGKELADFQNNGELDDDLYSALYDYYFDDMPYGTKKARTGDPYEWISQRLDSDMNYKFGDVSDKYMATQKESEGERLGGDFDIYSDDDGVDKFSPEPEWGDEPDYLDGHEFDDDGNFVKGSVDPDPTGEVITELQENDEARIIDMLSNVGLDHGLDFWFEGDEIVVIGSREAKIVTSTVGGHIQSIDGEEFRIGANARAAKAAPADLDDLAAVPELMDGMFEGKMSELDIERKEKREKAAAEARKKKAEEKKAKEKNKLKEDVSVDDVEMLTLKLKSGQIGYDEFREKLDSLEQTDYSMRQGEMGLQGDDTPAGNRAWAQDASDYDDFSSQDEYGDDEFGDEEFEEDVTDPTELDMTDLDYGNFGKEGGTDFRGQTDLNFSGSRPQYDTEVGEGEFANSAENPARPEVHTSTTDMINQGNDLNRPKKSFSHRPYRGDNPMAESAKLLTQYNAMKAAISLK